MTHLVLPLVTVVLAPPLPPVERERKGQDGPALPLVFVALYVVAMALAWLEVRWSPLNAGQDTTLEMAMPQL